MKALALVMAVALGLALVVGSSAQDKPRLTREQALQDLTSPDVEARRLATAWLGELATPDDLPALFRQLRDSDDLVRALTENSIWQTWSRSGDAKVDALFKVGVEQMNQGRTEAAIDTFTEIIKRKPDFAEGWNRRATVRYLAGEYKQSLADCDEVIKRNPRHFGALSGYGQIYFHLEQYEKAIEYWKRALEVNPNMLGVEMNIKGTELLLAEKRKRST